MTHLAFLAFALGGFFICLMVLRLVLPSYFSGEAFHPMTYLIFLAFALGGFLTSIMVLQLVLPVLFSGEVFSPILFPLMELVCLVALSVPFALVQRRLTISLLARKLLPFFYGFFSLPVFFLPPFWPHENIWVAGYRKGMISTPVSFAIAYGVVKVVDLAKERMDKVEKEKMEQEKRGRTE